MLCAPLFLAPAVQRNGRHAPPLHQGKGIVGDPLVGVDPVPHLYGQRLGQDGRHGPNDVLQRPLPRHESRAHALLEDEVDGAAHVDVDKVTVHLLLQQLRNPRHLGRTAAAHLETVNVILSVDEGRMKTRGNLRFLIMHFL